jgi:DGQHR domain-containing protein
MTKRLRVPGFVLQDSPRVYVMAFPGMWLLRHSTPSWRIRNPEKGFQRMVKEKRARAIAAGVLDQGRNFPNSLVLATNIEAFESVDGKLSVAGKIRFLVVDGQHRLWAQKFSEFHATYSCVVHMGLTRVQMAELFLEINDNQKRVPSSLRWDLVRLVRPKEDQFAIAASELVFELATDDESPLFQRIDLTGEQPEITLKQGSLAPEIKLLVSAKASPLRKLDFDSQYDVLVRYFASIRATDPDGWKSGKTPFYQARVVRMLIRLLPALIKKIGESPTSITPGKYKTLLAKIDKQSLSADAIRAAQGSAGMKEIYDVLHSQVFRADQS